MTCAALPAQPGRQLDMRRMTGLEQAGKIIGQKALGEALGVDERSIRAKRSGERGITARDLDLAATAMEAEAARILVLADKIRALYQDEGAGA